MATVRRGEEKLNIEISVYTQATPPPPRREQTGDIYSKQTGDNLEKGET